MTAQWRFLANGVAFGEKVKVLLPAELCPFEHFHNRGDPSHTGDGRLFDGHTVAFGALLAHCVTA